MRDIKKIIIAPILSEKSEKLKDFYNQYVFKVDPKSNKIDIRKAIELKFDVKVKSIRTLNMPRKSRTRHTKRGMVKGKTAGWKKAIITVEEGYSIDVLENV